MPGQLIEKGASAFVIILHPGCLEIMRLYCCGKQKTAQEGFFTGRVL
jgi:hypothetical protein